MSPSFVHFLKRGLAAGGAYAVLFAVAHETSPNSEAFYGVSAAVGMLLAIIGGLAAGAIVGLLAPHVRNWIGYVITAQLALLPVISLATLYTVGANDFLSSVLPVTCTLGVGIGTVAWFHHGRKGTS